MYFNFPYYTYEYINDYFKFLNFLIDYYYFVPSFRVEVFLSSRFVLLYNFLWA